MGSMMNKQMLYMMPMITVIFGITFPSGLVVYWVVTTLFAIGQQYLVLKKDKVQQQVEK
jgi:YidC/Oxa1 family membrane protein insertase